MQFVLGYRFLPGKHTQILQLMLRVEKVQLRVQLRGLTAKAEAIFEETVPSIAAKTEGNFAQGTIAEFALSY